MNTQKQSPKDAVSEGIATLVTQLESGNSAALNAHLAAMGRFHKYSFGNVMLIAMQSPDASRVAGFQTWKKLNRNVKKGEKAIRILAPMVRKTEAAGEDSDSGGARVFGFRSVCVFDISQTEGEALPEFAGASGEAGDTLHRLLDFAAGRSITVEFSDDLGGALGVSRGGKIEILSGQSDAETIVTLAHEIAHEILHKSGDRGTKTTRELEAESVAFIVGTAVGLDMSTSSADYIKLYNGDSELLKASLEAISRASREILAAVIPSTPAVSEAEAA
jgi:hypothetical protein